MAVMALELDAPIEPAFLGPTWERDRDTGRFSMPKRTLGWVIAAWCYVNLKNPDGGPWVFTREQMRFVCWMYALDDQGHFRWREVVLQRLKGWGKDPLAAVICAVELVGPCRPDFEAPPVLDPWGNEHPAGKQHPHAWIDLAAVSKEQTRNTMSIFPSLFTNDCIRRHRIKVTRTQVLAEGGAKFIRAVTSNPAALEGARPTFQLQNETQHWLANNEGLAMADVMERNATKAADGSTITLKITNAYEPSADSVAQRDREAWEEEQGDGEFDTGVMYDSIEAPETAIITRPRDLPYDDFVLYLERVVDAVRGDSHWLQPRVIVRSILNKKNPPSRSRRFYFNQIHATEDAWLDPMAVSAAAHELISTAKWDHDIQRRGWGLVSHDEPIVMFFDGSKSDDETGLVGCRLSDMYLFSIGCWFRPPRLHKDEPWHVDRNEVDLRVEEAFERFNIVAFWGDPGQLNEDDSDAAYWTAMLDKWHRQHKEKLQVWAIRTGPNAHSIIWDMRSRERTALFTAAAMEFVSEMERKDEVGRYAPTFRFDGNPRFVRHLKNAKRYPNEYGVSLWKGHRESKKKVDLAVCAVGARMLARFTLNRGLEPEPGGDLWGFRRATRTR